MPIVSVWSQHRVQSTARRLSTAESEQSKQDSHEGARRRDECSARMCHRFDAEQSTRQSSGSSREQSSKAAQWQRPAASADAQRSIQLTTRTHHRPVSMSSDKLKAMEPNDEHEFEEADDGSDSDGCRTQRDKQQRRKRRRKDAVAAAAAEAAQTGEKDHLFFSLKSDPASSASSAASTLVIRGFSCTVHADSAVAAALRSEAHLQFLDTAPPRVAVENADDEPADEPLPTSLDKYDTSLDKYDVRLIAPVAEWRQTNVDEERDDDLDEPAPEIAEEDHAALAAKVSAPFEPTLIELTNERLSKEDYTQLHRQRYCDWWSALKNQPAASDAAATALGGDTAMSDAPPSAPSMDRAISEEEDSATLEGQFTACTRSQCWRVHVSLCALVCVTPSPDHRVGCGRWNHSRVDFAAAHCTHLLARLSLAL